MSLDHRKLDFVFQLGQGNFGEGGFDTVELKGLRASASITYAGGISFAGLSLTIYGVPLKVMNSLVTLGTPIAQLRRNTVTVYAQSGDGARLLVFTGIINLGWINAQASPEVSFVVSASAGALAAMQPAQALSVDGTGDVAGIMGYLAVQLGYGFENNGVNAQVSNPYLPGAPLDQIQALARMAGVQYVIDNNTLAIWPRDGGRNGTLPLISAETGMVGYPIFTQTGISIKTIYNPNVVFMSYINVKSVFEAVNGRWQVFRLAHELESEMPGGKWFTSMECSAYGQPLPF